uniref:Hemerythrin n=1 Tax=Drilonereis sp. EP-2017 TaxID=1964462 RepID=A0A1S6QCX9_9ANNE|nr:hemerythrin [Drilonereis sp. EP-2017]
MGKHAIPEPYKWNDSFQVFYDSIDKQHQGLFDGVFAVEKAPGDGGKLAALVKIVGDHFSAEEAMMTAKNYPAFSDHKAKHDEFLGTIKGLSAPVDGKTVDFAKDWLVNHIKEIDFGYKGKL